MASENDRETVVKRLLLAHSLDNRNDKYTLFSDIPDGSIIGFDPSIRPFLTSVADQVNIKRFITYKQLEAVAGCLMAPAMQYQFSWGIELPRLPDNFKWVNFPQDQKPATRVESMATREPDLRDAGEKPVVVAGKYKLNLTEELSKPWGRLSAENGELVFEPFRYPTTNIKSSGKWAWDGSTKTWRHQGIHPEVIDKLFKVWAEIEVDESVDLALAGTTELVELPDEIATHGTLFEFQKEATQFLLSHDKVLLALAPGLGKTATAITAGNQLLQEGKVNSIGIIAPKSLLKNWQDEIEKWVDAWSRILHPDFKEQPLDADWLIGTYDMLSRGTLPAELAAVDLVIFDESILISNHGRTKEVNKATGKQRWVFKTKRVQAAFEIARQVDYCWLLSGGPTSKYVDDLWAQLHILDPKRFSSYWRFAEDYCLVERNPWTKVVTGNQPGAIQKIHTHYVDIIFARSQDQVLDLPEWIFEEIQVPMSRKQEQAYDEMAVEWKTNIITQQGEIQLNAPNIITQVTRLCQIASNPILLSTGITAMSPKWAAVMELMTIRPGPFIIWTRFVETARRMEYYLQREGYRVASMTGSTPATVRQDIVHAFQAGHLDAIVAHPKVGKFGLTLTAARTTIYLENSYDGDDYYQSLHRVRRIGTTHAPLVITLKSTYADGRPTVDHLIADVLAAKADTTFKITAAKLESYLGGR